MAIFNPSLKIGGGQNPPLTISRNQAPAQSRSSSQVGLPSNYIKFETPKGPAFFEQSPTGLAAVSSPETLRRLQSGELQSTTQGSQAPGAARFAPGVREVNPQTGQLESIPEMTKRFESATTPATPSSSEPRVKNAQELERERRAKQYAGGQTRTQQTPGGYNLLNEKDETVASFSSNDELNKFVQGEIDWLKGQSSPSGVTATSDQANLGAKNAVSTLSSPTLPTAPSQVQQQKELREQYGIQTIEDELSDIEGAKLAMGDEFIQFKKQAVIGATGAIANRRIQARSEEAQMEFDRITRQEMVLERKLANRNNAISQIMQAGQQDYQNAFQQYQVKFNQAIQLQNIYNKEAEDLEKNAAANLGVLTDVYKSGINAGTIDVNNLSDLQVRQIEEYEMQANRPVGATLAILQNTRPDEKEIASSYDKETGEFFYATRGGDGTIKTRVISTGQGGGRIMDNAQSQEVLSSSLPNNQKNGLILTNIIRSAKKIGEGTKTQIANILGVINAAEDMAMNNISGEFTGLNPFRSILDFKLGIPWTDKEVAVPFRESLKRKGTIENEEYINGINLKVQMWASGAALTVRQTEQVAQMTPTVNDPDYQVRTKLNALTNFMFTQAKSQLQSQGVTFTPQKVDLFETQDLLNNASSEQIEQLKNDGLL